MQKTVYSYDRYTGEYLGALAAHEHPTRPGNYVLPAFCTETAPPPTGPHEAAVYDAAADAWSIVLDWRGVPVWDSATGEPWPPTMSLGPLPTGLVTEQPPAAALAAARAVAMTRLSNACEESILAGFWSDALGQPHFYASSRDDQLNLAGAVAGALALDWPCQAGDETAAVARAHTAAQLLAVLQIGAQKKKLLLDAHRAGRGAVMSAVSDATVQIALAAGLSALTAIRTGDAPNA